MPNNNFGLINTPKQLVKDAVETRLPKPMRQEMEKAFATDLSDVKIYQSHAPTLQGAKSFVDGNNIHFAPGAFDPHSNAGRELIGHELAHVVQQRGGIPAVQSEALIKESINNNSNDRNSNNNNN